MCACVCVRTAGDRRTRRGLVHGPTNPPTPAPVLTPALTLTPTPTPVSSGGDAAARCLSRGFLPQTRCLPWCAADFRCPPRPAPTSPRPRPRRRPPPCRPGRGRAATTPGLPPSAVASAPACEGVGVPGCECTQGSRRHFQAGQRAHLLLPQGVGSKGGARRAGGGGTAVAQARGPTAPTGRPRLPRGRQQAQGSGRQQGEAFVHDCECVHVCRHVGGFTVGA